MSLITSTRNQQANLIEQNKASIVITRISKVSDGAGGWTTSEEDLDSQDIRIYSKRTRVLVIDDGGYHSIRITKGLAKYDADVKKYSSNNEDKFTYNGKNYRIFDVIDRGIKSEIVYKELELEQL